MKRASSLAMLALSACSLESHQTAAECEARLMPATLAKVRILPRVDVLAADARSSNPEERGVIAHELWGDRAKFPPLARTLQAAGFRTSVDPEEYGWHLRLDEEVDRFRSHASRRVRELCRIAEEQHLRYRGWWLYAGRHTDYVMQ